jgi:hypothetical protein
MLRKRLIRQQGVSSPRNVLSMDGDVMGTSLMQSALHLAEAHVVATEQGVIRQEAIVRRLRAWRRDSSKAEMVLANLRDVHARCILDRNRLLGKLELLHSRVPAD